MNRRQGRNLILQQCSVGSINQMEESLRNKDIMTDIKNLNEFIADWPNMNWGWVNWKKGEMEIGSIREKG